MSANHIQNVSRTKALYCQYKRGADVIVIKLREMMAEHQRRTGETLTYEVVSARTGLSRSTVESIATRKRYNASLATIERLCGALHCTPGELLEMKTGPATMKRPNAKR